MSSESRLAACTVYFDGACPLCRREVDHYRRQVQSAPVTWIDVSTCHAAELGADLDRAAALARMHVRRADGQLVSGAAAFAEIWRHLPAYAWLARLAAWPRLLAVMEAGYVGFLKLRRLWRRPSDARAAPSLAAPTSAAAGADRKIDVRDPAHAAQACGRAGCRDRPSSRNVRA
jgi:predicted DCC family thiol-disulfide oxidoreductase YuxK